MPEIVKAIKEACGEDCPVWLHWGIYAFRRDILEKFVQLPAGRLENCEKLESENPHFIKANYIKKIEVEK